MTDKVKPIGVQHRDAAEGKFLVLPPPPKCSHWNGPFEVDVKQGKCKCKKCGEEVSPIFVLDQLMRDESTWRQLHVVYQDEMKRLGERRLTKCQHCKQMTRISASGKP